MDATGLLQRKLASDEKCIICILGRVTEDAIHSDRYIGLVERQGDHAIFLYSAKTIPCFNGDDLLLEDTLKIDGQFRYILAQSPKLQTSQQIGPNQSLLDEFDPLKTVAEPPIQGFDSGLADSSNFVIGIKTNNRKLQLRLPDDAYSKKFLSELKKSEEAEYISNFVQRFKVKKYADAVFDIMDSEQIPLLGQALLDKKAQSQNAAFGLPSSFTWLEKYTRQSQLRHSDNPFANDVFDPFKYMNIEKPQGDFVTAENMQETLSVASLEDSLEVLSNNKFGSIQKAESHDSLDNLDTFNGSEPIISDSMLKITNQLGIGGQGVEFVNNLKPTTTRENIVRCFMNEREDEFTYKNYLRVFCGTWNVNGQSPPQSLAHWLQKDDIPPDIYAVGFQELDLSSQAYVFADSAKEGEWYKAVRRNLHPKATYKTVKLVRLVGIMLIVFIKEELVPRMHFIDSESVATGIMGIMGNKGGVGVRLSIDSTSICFLNSHLAAHQDEFERRNQDYRDIESKMRFKGFVPPLTIKEHDMVFWIGDLNYRIGTLDIEKVKTMIDKGKFKDLQLYDQLHQQLGRTDVFKGYLEGNLNFKPTYKYNTGSDDWDSSEKNRVPAWCDRVLYKGSGITQLAYRSHPGLLISDHKPVSSLFEVEVKVIDREKSRKVYEDIMKKIDRLENEYLPQVKLDKMEIMFKDVKFIEPQEQKLTVCNTGQVPVEFEFIKKLDESSYCKPWMKVSPFRSVIVPGTQCEVSIEVYVEKTSVGKLDSTEDQIEDILVLHLHGGKDFFITVGGNFIPSSFGCSIEALVQMHGPVREVPVEQLVEIEQPGSLLKRDMTQGGRLYAVPKEVWRLVDHLWQYGRHQSDLFQQPGMNREIQAIRDCLDTGTPETIPGSIHSVAEALLLFLESLPDPVIPTSVYKRCLECSNNYMLCKQVLSQIPECHKNLFRYLTAFLRELLSHTEHNNLDVKFLASMFGDLFLRSPSKPKLFSQLSLRGAERNQAKEEEMKRAAFVYHFLTNEYDE